MNCRNKDNLINTFLQSITLLFFRSLPAGYQQRLLRQSTILISASVDMTDHLQTTWEDHPGVLKHWGGNHSLKWEEVKISSSSKQLCCCKDAQLHHVQETVGDIQGKTCLIHVSCGGEKLDGNWWSGTVPERLLIVLTSRKKSTAFGKCTIWGRKMFSNRRCPRKLMDNNPVKLGSHRGAIKRRQQMKTDKLPTERSATSAPSKASWLATSRKESNA